jgi:hypothetical protein
MTRQPITVKMFLAVTAPIMAVPVLITAVLTALGI